MGFPGGSDGKASTRNAGDPGSIPGSEDRLEKEMATHSSILAWKISWMEPGRLQSMGSQRVGHDWATSLTHFKGYRYLPWASLVAQTVKRRPAMWDTQVQSLGREDAQEKDMTTHSSTLAWKIPWNEEPGRLQSHGVAKSRTWLSNFTSLKVIDNILTHVLWAVLQILKPPPGKN